MAQVITLLSAATATGAGTPDNVTRDHAVRSFQAVGTTSSGGGAASIDIEVSNDGANWLVAGSISLTLSTTASTDGFVMDAAWRLVRANVKSISGTGASVTVTMGA